MRQYQKFFQQMIDENKELFNTFKSIHDAYILNPQMNQERFNAVGQEIVDIVRDYERKLCGNMNAGVYGAFSQNLSQKFWEEIRKVYPKIDFVGAQIG
jgi:hypothetical protein